MKKIAQLPENQRRDLYRNTSEKMGFHDAIVEKDFWVCFTLDYLFHHSPWKDTIVFKGGTSLSKAFNLIQRFSEDIDLILDWRILGYGLNEPWEERSKTKQDAFNKEVVPRTSRFLKTQFIPEIKKALSNEMQQEANIYLEGEDCNPVVIFAYPRMFENASTLPVIRLEIGPLAAWTPAQSAIIYPYVAEQYPQLFEQAATEVVAVMPKRTFWEKATILHMEANRSSEKSMPARYSRHYYDLFRMSATQVKCDALNDLNLLRRVVLFKMKFYPANWAKYDEAVPGTFKLVPPDYRLEELKKDYTAMEQMLFGNIPTFEEVLAGITALEAEINSSGRS